MKTNDITFEYVEDFADYIADRVESNEDSCFAIVGKFEEIKNVIKEIMTVANVDFESIDLYSSDINSYTDEYVLGCWYNDGVVQIGCEPLKVDGEYLRLEGDEIYLFDNVSSKIIPLCKCSELYFVDIEDECDCEEECDCCCECCTCDEDNIYGFTVNSETDNGYSKFTYYSSNPVSEVDIINMLKKLGY